MHDLTAGLVADRDPAQPLLTYVNGPARIELSGATTANWVCKTANLVAERAADRVGLLLPLHWQSPCLLLGAVAAGATVVLADSPDDLAGCAIAFTRVEDAEAALDAGVDDVFACSLTPFANRLAAVPPMVLDAALEIPVHGDRFGGRPASARIERGGAEVVVPRLDLQPADRVLVDDLVTLLGVLRAGAAAVLLVEGDREAVARQEGVTKDLGSSVA